MIIMSHIALLFYLIFFLPVFLKASPVYRCAQDDCPSHLAIVSSPGKNCVAFLKGPDEIITAGHCLPENGLGVSNGCTNVKVIFPEVRGASGLTTYCKKIVSQSDPNPKSILDADWAILKIDQSPAREVPIFGGILDNKKKYQIQKLKVDHSAKLVSFEEQACPLVFSAALNISSRVQGDNPTLTLLPCEVLSGNSGSPVVDSAGRIIGLVNGNNTIVGSNLFPSVSTDKVTATIVTDINCVGNFMNPCAVGTSLAKNIELVNENTNKVKTKLLAQRDQDLLQASKEPLLLGKLKIKTNVEYSQLSRVQEKQGLLSEFKVKPYCLFPDSAELIKDKKFFLLEQRVDLRTFSYSFYFDEHLRLQTKVENLVEALIQTLPLSSEDRKNGQLRLRLSSKKDSASQEVILSDCDLLKK